MFGGPDEADEEEAESPREHMMRMAAQQSAAFYRPKGASSEDAVSAVESRGGRKAKEPMLKQYLVTVFVMEDAEVNPDATVVNAQAHIWDKYGNREGRFRVTRADVRKAMWQEPGEDEEAEFDQLRLVCDYVAKGANAADARVKITKALEETGVSVVNMDVQETASLRAAEPYAVPEDLPTLEELRRRAGL